MKPAIHIAKPHRGEASEKRDPATTQAWLIGSGIASLSAAVHLIRDANVTPSHIHILDVHSHAGGGITGCGNAQDGYVLYTGSLPYFHDRCVEELLSLVPSLDNPEKSLLDSIKDADRHATVPQKQKSTTRLIRQGKDGPECVHINSLQIGPKYRMELMRIMLENERSLGDGAIRDYFDEAFFKTNFWMQWSTTFALQPWHSVAEFRRGLCKHLADIEHLNDIKPLDRTKYTIYESIIQPISSYLERIGVDFHFHARVTRLETHPDSPHTVTNIVLTDTDTKDPIEKSIVVAPSDIVLATLGSTSTGTQTGTNTTSPKPSSPSTDKDSAWTLWHSLSEAFPNAQFGSPSHFTSHTPQTTLTTFTTTLHDTPFLTLYSTLTATDPGTTALLTLSSSPWCLSLSIPAQPVCPDQPSSTHVIWGYGLHPLAQGTFVPKPMTACTGEEIATEVFSHLGLPVDELLPRSNTIPCVIPLATAPLLPRKMGQRAEVVAGGNLALVGQFVEITDDTTLSMEYSVRGAQMAVGEVMGLERKVPRIERHMLLSVFDLLGGA
ncbi:67 kDa myosin-cross-reactive antigen like protein [Aspergillus heteromorphus CBS 117.55]|uniref:67 kDa myosin-cross-reactive antigen like protein n=1 Tax=Aspergillus heteromorphus CBS 117.55 TaxID=1448321 RepID=A0A317WGN4_9EURO|nr:67 kDa myosin-cross-reactive antigen like protein [Aspergillus heteromorphus CBS 117.55]PWY84831.1 67 kDa myosin-cross-reactive antigen like protein [Aspergillus heteromorphus CBS 117.55]